MKYIFFLISITLLVSCSDSFINHSLKANRIGNCSDQVSPIKMVSNINGERYEFENCLEDGFNIKNYTIERKGDSLLVHFPTSPKNKALYKLILDIDAKPGYRHITLGDRTLEIVKAER